MASTDSSLYGIKRHKRLQGDKEISSNTTMSFSSQLGSLISSSTTASKTKPTSQRLKPKKEDLFRQPNRDTHKRAKRDLDDPSSASPNQQQHTTNGGTLDRGIWERSKRKMEEKARLYAAIKRGDLEDDDDRYAVDFDRKWAEATSEGHNPDLDSDEDEEEEEEVQEQIFYTDEFGRTRTGTRAEAARAARLQKGRILQEEEDDRFTARPSAPNNVIYGDTIQHHAFNPDASLEAQMEALAKKRDKSLTPPPEEHFDASREVRTKGTGFFQFSGEAGERKRQMEGLEWERAETEARRRERGKRKAEEFLDELGVVINGERASKEPLPLPFGVVMEEAEVDSEDEDVDEDEDDPMARLEKRGLANKPPKAENDMHARIEAAIQAEADDDDDPMARLEKRALSS